MPFNAKETFPISTQDLQSWTFDHVNYDWDTPMYTDALNTQRHVTARQAQQTIRQLIAGFHAIGLQKNDCVCIHSVNDIQYAIAFHGVVGAGGIFAATNPAYTPYELGHTFRSAQVKYVLTMPEVIDNVLKSCSEAGIPKDHIIIFNPDGRKAPEGFLQWKDLLSRGEEDWARFDDLETSKKTVAALLFSSGTTGLPKAVMLSHYNLIAQNELLYEANPRPWQKRYLFALPLFHAASAPSAYCQPLRSGSPSWVLSKFDLETWFWAIEKYQVTELALVPPIAVAMVNVPFRKKYSLKSIRSGACGAAPIDKHLQARVQELIGSDASLTQVWGMTETSCVTTRFPWPETDTTGSIGYPLPGMDLKLVDEDGKDISAYDVRGEMCVRGPLVAQGYFNNPEANARDWDSEGYFHTGDICYCDGQTGKWYIVDRKKELIKVRGFQVAPAELEGVLLAHADIVDCAVIGVTDPTRQDSELPRAYIVRRDQKSNKPSEEEVHQYIKDKLVYYKTLTGGIVFTDVIPKSPNGKILKRILKEQLQKEGKSKL